MRNGSDVEATPNASEIPRHHFGSHRPVGVSLRRLNVDLTGRCADRDGGGLRRGRGDGQSSAGRLIDVHAALGVVERVTGVASRKSGNGAGHRWSALRAAPCHDR